MQTSFSTQIQAIRNVRGLLAKDKNLLNSLPDVPVTFSEIDKALNDAGSSLAAFSMGYGEKKRAIELIEKLIEKLNSLGDKSLVKDEAINYVLQFKK